MEPEWHQAATGGNPENEYPWGAWTDAKANTSESRLGRTTAVGGYPGGASPQGVLDLAGNVWAWCLIDYARPGETRPTLRGVVRGGSWLHTRRRALRLPRRLHPGLRYLNRGFRVVRGAPIP